MVQHRDIMHYLRGAIEHQNDQGVQMYNFTLFVIEVLSIFAFCAIYFVCISIHISIIDRLRISYHGIQREYSYSDFYQNESNS